MVKTLINSNQINLGNESAIDLLLEQNTAKANLATNLSGKGITANASTETLNELVNKVANIQSTSDRELVKCITLNRVNAVDFNSYSRDANAAYYLKAKGYLFFIKKGISGLFYIKLSDMLTYITTQNTLTNLTANVVSVSISNIISPIYAEITANSDFTKIFVSGISDSGTASIAYFDVVWNGDDISSVTFNKYLGTGVSKDVYNISSNSDGSKLLYIRYDTIGVFLYDVANETTTQISGVSFKAQYPHYMSQRVSVRWVGDSEFVTVELYNSSWVLEHYSLTGSTATSLLESSAVSQGTLSTEDDNIGQGLKVVEYDTNKYKVFIAGSAVDTDWNYLKLCIYDTYTKTMTSYSTNIGTIGQTVNSNRTTEVYPIDIAHIGQYYIVSHCVNFLIFDENWNNINNVAKNNVNSNKVLNSVFFAGDYLVGIRPDFSAIKLKYWFGKKTITKRTVSVNGTEKEFFYSPEQVAIADIENGYFD